MHTTPIDQAKYIFYLASLGFITGTIGLYNDKPYLGISSCIGSCVSMLYWMNPTFTTWRRYLDIVYVQYLFWIHMHAAYQTHLFYDYLGLQTVGIFCYILSWYYASLGLHTWATISHSLLHLIVQISASGLYMLS